MYYTVAQFARKTNKTKAEIYKLLDSKLKGYLNPNSARKEISEEALSLFIPIDDRKVKDKTPQENTAENKKQGRHTEEPQSIVKVYEKVIQDKDSLIDELKERLRRAEEAIEEKDKTIQETNNRLLQLLQNSQILIGRQQEIQKRIQEPPQEQHKETEVIIEADKGEVKPPENDNQSNEAPQPAQEHKESIIRKFIKKIMG